MPTHIAASPPSHARRSDPQQRRRANFLLTLPFLVLFLVQLYHHQLWRDELNVWGIALASPTLAALAHTIHYEGHPGLWYALLWFPSRLFASPAAMKWVEACIGTAIYLIIGMASPWGRLEKVLVFLGYYISFEYTVLSRTYGLCLLLALVYVCVRTRRPRRVLLCACLLGLLANTDTLGVLLSALLLGEYAWERYTARASWAGQIRLLATYAVFLFASYRSMRPAPDISWAPSGRVFSHAGELYHLQRSVLSNMGLVWFPISAQFPHKYWNPNVVLHPAFFAGVSLFATAALILVFNKTPRLLCLVLLAVVAGILFSHLVYFGFMRHFGLVFLAFLLAYWMQRSTGAAMARAALVLLAVSALGGVEAAAGQWMHPFSNSGAAAGWLRAHQLQNEPLAGFLDTTTIAVAEQLDRPLYFPQCYCSERFMLFSNRRDDANPAHLAARLHRANLDLQSDHYLLILDTPLTGLQQGELLADHQQVTPLAAFTGAEEDKENFYLYRIQMQTPEAVQP